MQIAGALTADVDIPASVTIVTLGYRVRCTEPDCRNLARLILCCADAGGLPMTNSEFCHAHARARIEHARTNSRRGSTTGKSGATLRRRDICRDGARPGRAPVPNQTSWYPRGNSLAQGPHSAKISSMAAITIIATTGSSASRQRSQISCGSIREASKAAIPMGVTGCVSTIKST